MAQVSPDEPLQWRQHQSEALAAIAAAPGPAHWVVMPPGAGKTLVGAEAARRTGRTTVAFAPNIAITQQWCDAWEQLTGEAAATSRDLETTFTALTYQSLAVFDAEADGGSPRNRLHANGEALIRRLHEAGPLTIILDECHHLLQVWGRLLDEVLAELDDAVVIALTATPPELLSGEETELVSRLFGDITYSANIPAVVSAGDLAPFAELVWFARPSKREREWLDERAQHYQEFITALTRVDIPTPLLTWLALQPFGALDEPVSDAVIRLALADEMALPDAAHVAERHRRPPDLADWIAVANGWLAVLRDGEEGDRAMAARIGELLPRVGYRATRHGIRAGQSLVDRVLTRSSSKALAAADIVADTLGRDPDARLLVLTDHATVSSLPADLDGVVEPQAGSARWILTTFLRDPVLRALNPLMVTGAQLAGSWEGLAAVVPPEVEVQPDGDVHTVVGWRSDAWVRAATDALAVGASHCLIGTRALLGEGWDARCVTGVIDLTSATTVTAIAQTRGRSLRVDPDQPDKVAVNWTVTCVAPGYPDGDADYRRLVRKHEGWFAVDQEGEVVDGVAHLDSRLSPAVAPALDVLPVLNATARARAADPSAIRGAWSRVTADREHPAGALRVRAKAMPALRPEDQQGRSGMAIPLQVAAVVSVLASLLLQLPGLLVLSGLIVALMLLLRVGIVGGGLPSPTLLDYAGAVADTLRAEGLSPRGAEAVVAETVSDGEVRIRLDGVDEPTSARFAQALEELLGPIESPRYVISRIEWVRPESGLRSGIPGLYSRRQVWHDVPTSFGGSRAAANRFARSWQKHVGAGEAIYIGSDKGRQVLSQYRRSSPFGPGTGLSTVQRRTW